MPLVCGAFLTQRGVRRLHYETVLTSAPFLPFPTEDEAIIAVMEAHSGNTVKRAGNSEVYSG